MVAQLWHMIRLSKSFCSKSEQTVRQMKHVSKSGDNDGLLKGFVYLVSIVSMSYSLTLESWVLESSDCLELDVVICWCI